MKVARVIGKVVLNTSAYEQRGGRFLLVSPMGKPEMMTQEKTLVSKSPSFVVYDELGAREDDIIGVTEGGEATRPFAQPAPVDAYNTCILDKLYYEE